MLYSSSCLLTNDLTCIVSCDALGGMAVMSEFGNFYFILFFVCPVNIYCFSSFTLLLLHHGNVVIIVKQIHDNKHIIINVDRFVNTNPKLDRSYRTTN